MKQVLFAAGFFLCLFKPCHAQLTSGLVAYWRMDGNFTDAGPNALATTNIGGCTATTNQYGQANKAMSVSNPTNTVTQFGKLGGNIPALNFTGDFSIDFAFYLNSPFAHTMGFFDNGININTAGNGYGYGVWMWAPSGFNQFQFNVRNGSLGSTSAANIQLATWNHATFVRSGSTLRIYINGVLNNSGTEGSSALNYTGFIPRIGTMNYVGQTPQEYNPLHGRIDELRIYNRVLTQAEISLLVILPVKLSEFTAVKKDGAVHLQWKTELEQNASHFNVQRSSDGVHFSNIARVQARGNSTTTSVYQYIDHSVKEIAGGSTVFYRLESVDIDGKTDLSSVIAIKAGAAKNALQVLQNPAVSDLRLQLSSSLKEIASLVIADPSGRKLLTRSVQLSGVELFTTIPISNFSAGTYYITLSTSEGKQTALFIKQ